jgi:hypothetical protein
MTVLGGGKLPATASKRQALREHAVSYLVSSQWLLLEAAADHLLPSTQDVGRRLAKTDASTFPGGAQELAEFLKATAKTPADLRFEATVELASERVRQRLARTDPPITHTQLLAYYRRHQQQFTTPERRVVGITNRKTRAQAAALKNEIIIAGNRFVGERETYEISPQATSRGKDSFLARAIAAAPLNRLAGPIHQYRDYFLFEVREVIPRTQRPLAEVATGVREQLASQSRQRRLTAAMAVWRQRWMLRTYCKPGYVVEGCSQFASRGRRKERKA